ncbi:transferrin-binding protein-like solute binding protein [Dichelobacter nodosus]|uniref:Outer membrane protein 1E n=1 Tax=Dichelobacter nodosus (strain VCS1703A) TaxID=246195 RepID=A5EW08_DICNV|nr:transferrin-binding protein-like solute binding protein [Dichelobacter nodosus]ABQ13351.1 outer membrane protein 1E [Dichelobacter nodosus VCS1703A]
MQSFPEATLRQIAPELAAKYEAEKEKRGANLDKVVDPTQTGVVDGFDLSKQASYGAGQYVRGEKSNFDKQFNPEENSAPTTITGVGLDDQNPKLTNIFFAKKSDKKDGKLVATQYVGIDPNKDVDDLTDGDSLQQQNKHNVALDRALLSHTGNQPSDEIEYANGQNTTTTFWGGANAAAQLIDVNVVDTQITIVKKALASYEKLEQADKEARAVKENKAILDKALADLEKIKADKAKYERTNLLVLDKYSKTIPWGDYIPTGSKILVGGDGAKAALVKEVGETGGVGAPGLIAVNFADEIRAVAEYEKIKSGATTLESNIQGTEENSYSSTRIFGKNFSPDGIKDVANSYKGATTVVSEASLAEKGATAGSTGLVGFADNKATFDDKQGFEEFVKGDSSNKVQNANRHSLAAEAIYLENVQYGRVSGDIDAEALANAKPEDGEIKHIQSPYTTRNSDKAVNQYFYRGTNATTLKEMEALPTDKILVYQGHALMYGIDNSFHGGKNSSLSYAFGKGKDNTAIGNFVRAEVDLNKDKVAGAVYNVWQKGETSELIPDNLVKFEGNVHGNTVLGTAERTYKEGTADFRASFFGKEANEMGGSFNSNLAKDGYTHEGDVWGGVFGAQRTVEPVKKESEYDNGWLISHGE